MYQKYDIIKTDVILMKIAIDIDNTICDTTAFFKEKTLKYDREILNKTNEIDLNKVIPRSKSWTIEELNYYIENIFNKESINIPIKKDAAYYINKLKEEYYITFITNRGIKEDDHTDKIIEQYLKKHNIPYDRIITKSNDKYRYIKDFDFFIDDSIKECEMALNNTRCKVIMMESPQNIEYSNNLIFKTNDWKKIYEYIKGEVNEDI